jgi:hypothetical protein
MISLYILYIVYRAYAHYLVAKQFIQGITLTFTQSNDVKCDNPSDTHQLTLTSDDFQKAANSATSSNNRIISSQLQAYWESLDQKLSACFSKCQLLHGFGLEDVDNCLTRHSQ